MLCCGERSMGALCCGDIIGGTVTSEDQEGALYCDDVRGGSVMVRCHWGVAVLW